MRRPHIRISKLQYITFRFWIWIDLTIGFVSGNFHVSCSVQGSECQPVLQCPVRMKTRKGSLQDMYQHTCANILPCMLSSTYACSTGIDAKQPI